jgi:hypothetical protein
MRQTCLSKEVKASSIFELMSCNHFQYLLNLFLHQYYLSMIEDSHHPIVLNHHNNPIYHLELFYQPLVGYQQYHQLNLYKSLSILETCQEVHSYSLQSYQLNQSIYQLNHHNY